MSEPGQTGRPATEIVDRDEATVHIGASPERVFAVLADVTRTPEWSPVVRSVEWRAPADEPAVGARFVGHNVKAPFRWTRECEITACEPPFRLAWRTFFKGRESTQWEYRLEADDGGTRVTERYEAVLLPRWIALLRKVPGAEARTRRDAAANIRTSLSNLARVVEGT